MDKRDMPGASPSANRCLLELIDNIAENLIPVTCLPSVTRQMCFASLGLRRLSTTLCLDSGRSFH